MNRLSHLAYIIFHWNSNGKIKKHISFRLQKDQGSCLSLNAYEVAMYNLIHDLVINLAVQCTCPGPWGRRTVYVCAEFLGLAISTGRPGMGIP